LSETIVLHNADATTTKIDVTASPMPKQVLGAEQFDVPAGYRQANSLAELNSAPQPVQQAAAYSPIASPTPQQATPGNNHVSSAASKFASMGMGAMTGKSGMMAQAQQLGMGKMMGGMGSQMQGGMPGAGGTPTGAPIALPQALGPKAPGKIRIGIAPAEAQLGQGNNAQADFGTPIRNSIVLMMNGPAVEIAALDARLPMQVQAEAQQKQCDYILFSNVTVKHGGGSFGKFMKMGSTAANITPVGMMAHSMTSVMAAQAATAAAAQIAQQQAMNQLSGFNGQIKSKDDVTVEYHLFPTGQDKARLENSLKGKAKSDGEDVLTPLIQQAANTILTEVTKK